MTRLIPMKRKILESNDQIAEENRRTLREHSVQAINLISSPGSGKTTLLVETLKILDGAIRCAVIEGDQQTDHDARRVAETGVPVVQINTGQGCHLDAAQVRRALSELPLDQIDLLFIENVGNLVCPAEFDLGETEKVVLMSVTEGEDKPVKYPLAFLLASGMVLTKMDLLPYLRFDLALCKSYVRRVNPGLDILETSCYTSGGTAQWLEWLQRRVSRFRGIDERNQQS